MQSDVICNKCQNISRTIDPLRDIPLDIPASAPATHASDVHHQPSHKKPYSIHLHDCLRKFTRKEELGNLSKIHCKYVLYVLRKPINITGFSGNVAKIKKARNN